MTKLPTLRIALACLLAGIAPCAPAAAKAPARYSVKTIGDIVQLRDNQADATVSVLTGTSNAYEFVVHGKNDPRVPVGEAAQIAEALQTRGRPVELLVFDDEGHGIAKRKNRGVAFPKMVTFLNEHVGERP